MNHDVQPTSPPTEEEAEQLVQLHNKYINTWNDGRFYVAGIEKLANYPELVDKFVEGMNGIAGLYSHCHALNLSMHILNQVPVGSSLHKEAFKTALHHIEGAQNEIKEISGLKKTGKGKKNKQQAKTIREWNQKRWPDYFIVDKKSKTLSITKEIYDLYAIASPPPPEAPEDSISQEEESVLSHFPEGEKFEKKNLVIIKQKPILTKFVAALREGKMDHVKGLEKLPDPQFFVEKYLPVYANDIDKVSFSDSLTMLHNVAKLDIMQDQNLQDQVLELMAFRLLATYRELKTNEAKQESKGALSTKFNNFDDMTPLLDFIYRGSSPESTAHTTLTEMLPENIEESQILPTIHKQLNVLAELTNALHAGDIQDVKIIEELPNSRIFVEKNLPLYALNISTVSPSASLILIMNVADLDVMQEPELQDQLLTLMLQHVPGVQEQYKSEKAMEAYKTEPFSPKRIPPDYFKPGGPDDINDVLLLIIEKSSTENRQQNEALRLLTQEEPWRNRAKEILERKRAPLKDAKTVKALERLWVKKKRYHAVDGVKELSDPLGFVQNDLPLLLEKVAKVSKQAAFELTMNISDLDIMHEGQLLVSILELKLLYIDGLNEEEAYMALETVIEEAPEDSTVRRQAKKKIRPLISGHNQRTIIRDLERHWLNKKDYHYFEGIDELPDPEAFMGKLPDLIDKIGEQNLHSDAAALAINISNQAIIKAKPDWQEQLYATACDHIGKAYKNGEEEEEEDLSIHILYIYERCVKKGKIETHLQEAIKDLEKTEEYGPTVRDILAQKGKKKRAHQKFQIEFNAPDEIQEKEPEPYPSAE